jgi:hypothetical protein
MRRPSWSLPEWVLVVAVGVLGVALLALAIGLGVVGYFQPVVSPSTDVPKLSAANAPIGAK